MMKIWDSFDSNEASVKQVMVGSLIRVGFRLHKALTGDC